MSAVTLGSEQADETRRGADPLDLSDSPAGEVRFGWLLILGFFLGFGGWAAVTPLDAAAVAPGVVVISGERKAVQHRDGGIIETINVQEGDRVEAGDLLLTLQPAELAAQENVLAARLALLKATELRLVAERDGLDFPGSAAASPDLNERDAALLRDAIMQQADEYDARMENYQAQISVLEQHGAELARQIEGYEAGLDASRRRHVLVTDQLAATRSLHDQGLTPVTQVRALEASLAQLDGEAGQLTASIAAAEAEISGAEFQILQARRAQAQDINEQLRSVRGEILDVSPRLDDARASLERTAVRAPASGTVVGLNVHTIGGVITGGELLMEIVPTDESVYVQTFVSPSDIDDVRVGMSTEVRFEVGRRRQLPIVLGELTQVSADRLTDDRSGAAYFRAEVEVPPAEIVRFQEFVGADAQLLPGMPAEVVIPTRSRTALEYLLQPMLELFWRSFREN